MNVCPPSIHCCLRFARRSHLSKNRTFSTGLLQILLISAILPLAACGRGDNVAGAAAADSAVADPRAPLRPPPLAAPRRTETDTAPPEIYYRLTDYEWYRQGQPLVHEGTPFAPHGPPRALRTSELRPLGRYGDVAYFVRASTASTPDSLFVPVFEGYWQPFLPTTRPDRQ